MTPMKNTRNDETAPQAFEPLDGSRLSRPLDLPRKNYTMVLIALALAVVVGFLMFNQFSNTVVYGSENQEKEVTAQINRGVKIEAPLMTDYVTLSNKKIISKLEKAGYVLYDNSTEEDDRAKGFDLVKIPSDITLEQATPVIQSGFNMANPVTLATYLPGTWRMLMNRSEGVEMKLKYVDFTANSANVAIENAINNQQFDVKTAGEMAKDSAGNFSQSGTVKLDGDTYYWTISTCNLSAVYNASTLPETAQYVGITLAKR